MARWQKAAAPIVTARRHGCHRGSGDRGDAIAPRKLRQDRNRGCAGHDRRRAKPNFVVADGIGEKEIDRIEVMVVVL